MAGRKLAVLRRWIREELRAEGADGAGFSDFFLDEEINNALEDLAEFYKIQDSFSFSATAGDNDYSWTSLLSTAGKEKVEKIIAVTYDDGEPLDKWTLERYLQETDKTTGDVRAWLLWGDNLILIGKVEAKTVKVWISRAPAKIQADGDTPETPYYADEAIKHFVITACYRESRNFERANFHWSIYQSRRGSVMRRAALHGATDHGTFVQDDYMRAFRPNPPKRKTDTNPGGV